MAPERRTTSASPRYLSPPRRPAQPDKPKQVKLKLLRGAAVQAIDRRSPDGQTKAERAEWLETVRDTFEMWTDADEDQRERELEDLAMYAGDQWPEDVKLARAGMDAVGGLPPVPARPCLVINKFREPVNQVLNGIRDADLGITLTPTEDFAELGIPTTNTTEIQTREGLIRRIQRESQASLARLWAAQRALIAGRGYYGVMTRFCEGSIDGPATQRLWDQELYVCGWYNQACVTLDPTHEMPDGSDAEGGFIGRWITWAQYKAKYPNPQTRRGTNLIDDMSDQDFVAFGEDAPRWFRSDGDLRAVHVVDYFYTVEESRTLLLLEDGTAAWEDEHTGDVPVLDSREVTEKRVKWCVLDGINPEPLEERDWPGPDIPIIKVVGEELQPYDEQRRVEGLVRPGRDSQWGFNAMASKSVELVALTPIPPVYTANGQTEGFEDWWNLSTTRTLPNLPYNFKDAEGQPVGPPTTINRDAPIQAVAMSLQMFDEAVQTTTRRHDPSLGKVDPSLKSGRAITQVIEQSKEGTSNFLDNLRIAIRREAVIENNLLYPIYGRRPGRLARIVDGCGAPQTIIVNQPAVQGPGGMPTPLTVPHPTDPTQPPQPMPLQHPLMPKAAQQFVLTPNCKADVNITIKKNFDTQRQEENELLVQLVQTDPSQMQVIGDLLWESADLPHHEELAKRYQAMLAIPVQTMLAAEAKGGQPISPPVQQLLDQAKQMGSQAQQEIQQLQQTLQAKTTEQQGKYAITQLQEQAASDRADKDREAKLAIAALSARVETLANEMALFMEERKRIGAHVNDVASTMQQHAYDQGERGKDRTHDIMKAQLDHSHTLIQQAQAAALAPPPAPSPDTSAPTDQLAPPDTGNPEGV